MKAYLVGLYVVAAFQAHDAWAQKYVATNTVKPDYPYEARSHHWEGSGVLQLHLRPDGTVKSVTLQESCGYKILDDSAIAAYSQWHFHPGTKVVRIPFTFTMH